MAFRLGVDVGGTFTDLLLFEDTSGAFWRHKTPSTPHDSSVGILTGIEAICAKAKVRPSEVNVLLHGTTVATNAVLEGKGARVGLVVTEGYRQIMQIARSFVPGGLAGWIVWPKPQPMAALEDTVETKGRMNAKGVEVRPIDEAEIRAALKALGERGVEAITVSLINAYVNGAHEKRIGEIAAELLPHVSVSLSHEVLPEMQEYERTLTDRRQRRRAPGRRPLRPQPARQAARDRHGRQAVAVALRRRPDVVGESGGTPGVAAHVRARRRRHRGAVGRAQRGHQEHPHARCPAAPRPTSR